MRPAHGGRRWWPRSVRQQLVLGVSAVVTVVLLTVGVASVLILRTFVTNMTDTAVATSLGALDHSIAKLDSKQVAVTDDAIKHFTGHAPGSFVAVVRDGTVIASAVFSEGEPQAAPADVIAAIEAQLWHGGPPRTVKLASLGKYRVQSTISAAGNTLVVGTSMAPANEAVARKVATTVVLIGAALIVTCAGTALVVRYALRPLRRVAATAAKVAAQPLTLDAHRITARVRYADPDNEVGVVGDTLNRLLENVDAALVHRVESDRRTRQFLTDASHELRTPLAAIRGYAELTRQDSADLPPTSEYALAGIETAAHRMTRLVDELLLLSRLDEAQDLQTEDVDLVDVTMQAVNDAVVSGPGHQWLTDLPERPVWVRGDHARLHQLVSNLLTNARVHTPAGVTVTTKIVHGANADGPYAELTVTDDGPGIDPDLLPHLFERFVRADEARSRQLGSTGLGLAIVLSIVEAHHGSVSVESDEERTSFRVRMPTIGVAATYTK